MKNWRMFFVFIFTVLIFVFGLPFVGTTAVQGAKYEVLTPQNTMLIIVDVQNMYIPGNPDSWFQPVPGQDMGMKLSNVKTLMNLAGRTGMPTLVTFESSDQGVYAMPEDLKKELPAATRQFIKVTFDITKNVDILATLQSSGVKNVLVCGAETDVCVLQSVTGLVKNGYRVYLIDDAVYTSTTLNIPALKRMEMIGAGVVKTEAVVQAVETGGKLEINNSFRPVKFIPDIDYRKEALVIVNFDDQSYSAVDDPKKEPAKRKRIQYTTHLADVFNIPVYFLYDGSITDVSGQLYIPPELQFIQADFKGQKALKALEQALRSRGITQVILGGVDEGRKLFELAKKLQSDRFEVYLMEDAVLADGGPDQAELDRLYRQGVIPSSLKIFMYDTTETVKFSDWPAGWRETYFGKIDKGEIYYIDALEWVKDAQESWGP